MAGDFNSNSDFNLGFVLVFFCFCFSFFNVCSRRQSFLINVNNIIHNSIGQIDGDILR